MTLSTVDKDGLPDARVLILKNVDKTGFCFAIPDLSEAAATALEKIQADPGFVTALWRLNAVQADEVEFWQGSATRRHQRLCYRRRGDGYDKFRLWP
jgi:pyridoxine/pyridoxamine 5'-phosphate oxidase